MQLRLLSIGNGIQVAVGGDVAVSAHHRGPEEGACLGFGKVHRDVVLAAEDRHDVHSAVLVDWHAGIVLAVVDFVEDLSLEHFVGEVVFDFLVIVVVILGLLSLLVAVLLVFLDESEQRLDQLLELILGGFRLLAVELVLVDRVVGSNDVVVVVTHGDGW